jgi:glycosyltransferase involved in cell wall biosynthesis
MPGLFDSFGRLGGDVPFEVIVVNDGSTDDTAAVLGRLASTAPFPVVAMSIPNAGRGAALNKAFDSATGRFIFIMDDDDTIPADAFRSILATWESIPEAVRDQFCGVCGLCVRPDGSVIGGRYPVDTEDSDFFTMLMVRGIRGDKREVFLRSALDGFRFPAVAGEKRVSTNMLWFYLAARYKARFVNTPFLVKTYRPDGITASGLKQRVRSPKLTREYYRSTLALFPAMPFATRLRLATSYFRFARHAGDSAATAIRSLPGSWIAAAMLPFGRLIAALDRRKLAR